MTANNLREAQAVAILEALERWLAAAPGRHLTAGVSLDGKFFARLSERRAAGGESLADALAQIGQVVAIEAGS